MNDKSLNLGPMHSKDFSHIFNDHITNNYVKRIWLYDKLDDFIDSSSSDTPYLVIKGETGTGKTSLLANFIRSREKKYNIVYYFFDNDLTDIRDPYSFVSHLYYSLSSLYDLNIENAMLQFTDLVELLKRRIYEIDEILRDNKSKQLIIIDDLDESIISRAESLNRSIIAILHPFSHTNNYRIIFSQRERVIGLHRLYEHKTPIVLYMKDRNQEFNNDIRSYLKNCFSNTRHTDEYIEKLVNYCNGSFEHAVQIPKDMYPATDFKTGWMDGDRYTFEDLIIRNAYSNICKSHEYKLHIIESRIGDEAIPLFWQLIPLIKGGGNTLPRKIICDIIQSENAIISKVFKCLEPYLNIRLYEMKEQFCRWYHSSFGDYLANHKKRWEIKPKNTSDMVDEYIEQCINEVRIVPFSLMIGYSGRWEKGKYENKLELIKAKYLKFAFSTYDPLKIEESYNKWFRFLGQCSMAAFGERYVKYGLFFKLLSIALWSFKENLKSYDIIIKKRDNSLWEEISKKNSPTDKHKLINLYKKEIISNELGFRESKNPGHYHTDSRDSDILILAILYLSGIVLNDNKSVYDICDRVINELEPYDVDEEKSDTENMNYKWYNELEIIIDGEYVDPKQLKGYISLDDYIRVIIDSATIIYMLPSQDIWLMGQQLKTESKLAVGYLEELSKLKPGDSLKYEYLWHKFWGTRIENTYDDEIDTERRRIMQNVLYRQIWNSVTSKRKRQQLQKLIYFQRHKGLATSSACSFVIIKRRARDTKY